MRVTTRWACGVLAGLLLGACTGGEAVRTGDAPVAGSPPPVVATDEPAVDEPEAVPTLDDDHPLAFTARELGGGTVDAAELAGGHVVLWLWTPW
jgi:hypothetical protein